MINKLDLELGKISIIIPVYNVAKYLSEALDSVLNQTYSNLEIIIIDDGSTDGSEKICDYYASKDSRIVVVHQNNQGLSAARNKGLDIMTGEYVSFLDPDDVILPKFIDTLYYTIKNTYVDCVICNYATIYSEDKTIDINNKPKKELNIDNGIFNNKEILSNLVDGKINMAVWNKLYKKELWKDVRFPVGYVYEDVITIYKIFSKTYNTCITDDLLLIHRNHKNSITGTLSLKNISDFQKAHYELAEIVKSNINGIFNEYQYNDLCRRNLFMYISKYFVYKVNNIDNNKKIELLLKNNINDLMKNVNKKDFNLKNKIIYFMYNNCPSVLEVIYKLYFFKKSIVERVFCR